MSQFGEPWKDGKFKVSARISGGEDDETDLEMRADDGQKFTIGTIDDEYAARVIACLNACYGIPTEVLEKLTPEKLNLALAIAANELHLKNERMIEQCTMPPHPPESKE
jgi:hypothetical protein